VLERVDPGEGHRRSIVAVRHRDARLSTSRAFRDELYSPSA
jgi:hypothetical protein